MATQKQPSTRTTFILADQPTDTDALDFTPYVNTLIKIIRSPKTATPLTIGVFGTWGSGKTSLMRMVQKGLGNFPTVWFDAWKYDKEEALWRALLLQVLGKVRALVQAKKTPDEKALEALDDLEASLYRAVEREELGNLQINWSELLKGSLETAVQTGIALIPGLQIAQAVREAVGGEAGKTGPGKLLKAIERAKTQIYVEHVQSLEQFQCKFKELVRQHISSRRKLVVFVDDLDRCTPEKAIEVLEAIKLFLDVPGCLFVLGVDQAVIARGVELKYRELGPAKESKETAPPVIDGTRYLEKIIQLPFQIPPIERGDMDAFVCGLLGDWPDQACPAVFAEGLSENPRQVKRTVNVFLLLWTLAQERAAKLAGQIKPIRLAKIVTIQNVYPELYEVLKRTPRLLRDLEDYYRAEAQNAPRESGARAMPEEGATTPSQRVEPPPALAPYVSRAAIRTILSLHPLAMPDANFSGLSPDELRLYFTLTRRAEAPQVAPLERPRAAYEPEMVSIPAGSFLMGSSEDQASQGIRDGLNEEWVKPEQPQHAVDLAEYRIGKYPVTNDEYLVFVREAGHRPPPHWDHAEPPADTGDHPVVNVSWEDAVAYCQWLSQKTGRAYRLPGEDEWENAARGADGRIYPWGDEFDPQKCNSAEGGVGKPTPVGHYSPQGDSPYGCVDMSGNVWEWMESWYQAYPGSPFQRVDYGEKYRVLRGGSWGLDRRSVRAVSRGRDVPDDFDDDIGFRVSSPG